jgi:hypothetical protein
MTSDLKAASWHSLVFDLAESTCQYLCNINISLILGLPLLTDLALLRANLSLMPS